MAGLLSDYEIQNFRPALITPFDDRCVQPASYDLTLHSDALVPSGPVRAIDLRVDDPGEFLGPVSLGTGYELASGGCMLASTQEFLRCPNDISARVEGKSSLGRLFLAVHVTAGWIDPGFQGQITLEIVNLGPWPVVLWTGMKIAQVNFTRMKEPCRRPYGGTSLGSHYQGQRGPTSSSGRRGA
jgi:dCTP deaminase